jgi:hypothetical protein
VSKRGTRKGSGLHSSARRGSNIPIPQRQRASSQPAPIFSSTFLSLAQTVSVFFVSSRFYSRLDPVDIASISGIPLHPATQPQPTLHVQNRLRRTRIFGYGLVGEFLGYWWYYQAGDLSTRLRFRVRDAFGSRKGGAFTARLTHGQNGSPSTTSQTSGYFGTDKPTPSTWKLYSRWISKSIHLESEIYVGWRRVSTPSVPSNCLGRMG